ncbi:thioredoxin family protein [Pseudooceanicola sp. HF7]|uniref:thioredoxin family protein n=1 Tax=Pseudooceanicola sp. HF7 TaxID=2721560 RepID=UPI0020CA781C|nr:thioredoxin family protein [Pseudooceanicola sp. HF7]
MPPILTRRHFIAAAGTASLLLPLAARAAPLDYTPGLVQEKLAAGETVFLDFKASWCTTCAAQERVLDALKAENPDYEAHVTFVDVDWDDYARADFTKSLRIPRRSTLVVLKGDEELGRIVAGTGRDQIKALMDTALSAAQTS